MQFGPKFIIPSAILVSLVLSLGLFVITAGASLPSAQSPGTSSIQSTAADLVTPGKGIENPDSCGVSEKFPANILKWCALITNFAQKTELPADLIAAVIMQESSGNHLAYSKSGAVGLMQVMPRDGLAGSFTCSNGPCFRNRPSTNELQDPAFNIQFGTQMLKTLKAKLGTYRDALKAYGPMDVGYDYADRVLQIYANYRK
jgi:soluble lytic murein transglycosylase-like protein